MLTSSITESLTSRSMRVCHRISTARRRASSFSASSSGVSGARSRSSSRRAIFHWQSRMLLRCTSVGCAVSTGAMSARAKKSAGNPCRCPVQRRALLQAKLPGRGGEPASSWARPRRMRCWSSAMLARCEKIAEGAHHEIGVLARQVVEQRVEFLPGSGVVVAVEVDRQSGGCARPGRTPLRLPGRG